MSLSKEADKVINHLFSVYLGYKHPTTKKVAKEILLYGDFTRDGRICLPKTEHIGCGVYNVSLEHKR